MQLPNIPTNWINKTSLLLRSRKVIIGIIIAVLVIEAIWAVRTLTSSKNSPAPTATNIQNKQTEKVASRAVLSLQTPKTDLKVGEKVTVNINLTSTKPTDGTDIILMYNPKLLSVVTNNPNNSAVRVGSLYSDYPVNSVDEKTGRIIVSGIVTKQGGIKAEGLFGSIEFQAKLAGRTKVVFDFTKGSTIDSNVIENKTSQELLDQVDNIEFNITK